MVLACRLLIRTSCSLSLLVLVRHIRPLLLMVRLLVVYLSLVLGLLIVLVKLSRLLLHYVVLRCYLALLLLLVLLMLLIVSKLRVLLMLLIVLGLGLLVPILIWSRLVKLTIQHKFIYNQINILLKWIFLLHFANSRLSSHKKVSVDVVAQSSFKWQLLLSQSSFILARKFYVGQSPWYLLPISQPFFNTACDNLTKLGTDFI